MVLNWIKISFWKVAFFYFEKEPIPQNVNAQFFFYLEFIYSTDKEMHLNYDAYPSSAL